MQVRCKLWAAPVVMVLLILFCGTVFGAAGRVAVVTEVDGTVTVQKAGGARAYSVPSEWNCTKGTG